MFLTSMAKITDKGRSRLREMILFDRLMNTFCHYSSDLYYIIWLIDNAGLLVERSWRCWSRWVQRTSVPAVHARLHGKAGLPAVLPCLLLPTAVWCAALLPSSLRSAHVLVCRHRGRRRWHVSRCLTVHQSSSLTSYLGYNIYRVRKQ